MDTEMVHQKPESHPGGATPNETSPGGTRPAEASPKIARRMVAFGDIHGDLDILAQSMAERGLLRYKGQIETLLEAIASHLDQPNIPALEELVIPQQSPVTVVLVGDLFDRYHHACQVVHFIRKIRWERFGIHLKCLLGNHDLLNFFFFTNPYEVHQLFDGIGHGREEVMRYIGSMGLADSFRSFLELHHEELVHLQTRLYRYGRLEIPLEGGTWTITYPRRIPSLGRRKIFRLTRRPTFGGQRAWECDEGELKAFLHEVAAELECPPPDKAVRDYGELTYYLSRLLRDTARAAGERDWWDISYSDGRRSFGFGGRVDTRCDLIWEERPGQVRVLPLDWRVISVVWRRHYGAHFLGSSLMHLEQSTLFVHAGISPLTLLDPLTFGSLYQPADASFRDVASLSTVNLEGLIERTNRLVRQLLGNTLRDWSFRDMSGAEVLDQIGRWRGSAEGLPEFGGPLWSDFEFLQHRLGEADAQSLIRLYESFIRATGLRRVVCGHTYYVDPRRPELRYLRNPILMELGLEYLCIDNGCSRGYRHERPVPTGIEIGLDGIIRDPGKELDRFW